MTTTAANEQKTTPGVVVLDREAIQRQVRALVMRRPSLTGEERQALDQELIRLGEEYKRLTGRPQPVGEWSGTRVVHDDRRYRGW